MLTIDKNIFRSNLRLTQQYCQLQQVYHEKDNAKTLRSVNPIFNKERIFTFENAYFNDRETAKWTIDPIDTHNLVNNLFEMQINEKRRLISTDTSQIFQGNVLVSKIDCTVIDGASEVQSLGFIDTYDLTPIDTWFYLTKIKESRLFFSWIPITFNHDVNEGVLVNCVDCFNWFENWYPKEFEKINSVL
jgi:hypothetical protein